MLYNYGTLGFYETKSNRYYDNTDNKQILHHFETDSIPAFMFVVVASVSVATYKLYDINDTEITSGTCTRSVTSNAQGTSYTIISLTGGTTSGEDDGKYYLKVTYDGTNVYSDVFCWRTTLTDYLKIVATSSALKIGDYPTATFTHTVYLDTVHFVEEPEIREEGEEKTYGDISTHVSRNRALLFEIVGYNWTLNFLTGLRVVRVNGTVTITWKGESYDVYDITSEKKSTYGNMGYAIDLKFKLKDYLSTYNNV